MELTEKEKLKSTLLTKVPFARNSTDISPGTLTALDEYIVLLKSNYFFDVEIGGHSSSRGTDAYNQTISEKRAKIVYDYLLKEGIDTERLTFKGYGESKLLDFENNKNADDKNRRIEFKVTGVNLEVQFQKNQYEIPMEAMKQLLFIVELLNANYDHKIIVEGHTDSSGDVSFNQNLSNLRAKSVYDFITKRGINKERVSYTGLGISKPRYSNETPEGRNKNRRIELKLSLDK
jgi:outer membrane protein OmpA-like peptidoglycan-associated protein